MNNPVSKEQLLAHIREGLSDAEHGISQHPPETAQIYQQGKAAFEQGQTGAEHPDWAAEKGLNPSDLKLMHDYLLATAFISAWFQSQGDKLRRDKAAQSATFLVSGLGFPPDDVMKRLMDYEQNWLIPMRAKGIGGHRKAGCLPSIIAGLIGIPCGVHFVISNL